MTADSQNDTEEMVLRVQPGIVAATCLAEIKQVAHWTDSKDDGEAFTTYRLRIVFADTGVYVPDVDGRTYRWTELSMLLGPDFRYSEAVMPMLARFGKVSIKDTLAQNTDDGSSGQV